MPPSPMPSGRPWPTTACAHPVRRSPRDRLSVRVILVVVILVVRVVRVVFVVRVADVVVRVRFTVRAPAPCPRPGRAAAPAAHIGRDALPGARTGPAARGSGAADVRDRKSTRLNSSHVAISYAVFCLKKKK